ncbi:MAG: hypothetical protein OXO51_04965 [Gemmatimonadota bacterium]|nr:hypothetical protein [Gemmatimonadota bacterium]
MCESEGRILINHDILGPVYLTKKQFDELFDGEFHLIRVEHMGGDHVEVELEPNGDNPAGTRFVLPMAFEDREDPLLVLLKSKVGEGPVRLSVSIDETDVEDDPEIGRH